MSFRAPRSGALALAVAIPFLASLSGPLPHRGGDGWGRTATRSACSRVAYVVGDSRRTLEHEVLPRTTDLIWGQLLGLPGAEDVDGMRHVRYLAEPGVVHERFTQELADLLAGCGRRERPLVFDFMGSNYAIAHPERIGDPAFTDEIRIAIESFYNTAAPQARVVLAELTFDRTAGDAARQAGIARYLDQYNGILRDLARRMPDRYTFLPAPAVYDSTVAWRDAAHETAESPMAEYLGRTPAGSLDAAGVALLTGRRGGLCTLQADARFGPEAYSEGVTLVAYLRDFRASRTAERWLGRDRRSLGRDAFRSRDATCPA